jgi:hypothetical protein
MGDTPDELRRQLSVAGKNRFLESKRAGDILQKYIDSQIPPMEYTAALHWLTHLTSLLQLNRTALYSTRRQILRQTASTSASTNITPLAAGLAKRTEDLACRRYFRSGTYDTPELHIRIDIHEI